MEDKRPRHVFITQNGDWMVQARNAEFKHFSCDGLVCTNPEYFDRHKDRYPSALIPNGVDTARFHPGEGDRARFGLPPAPVPIVLIVSALIPSKRVLEGIRSAAAVDGVFVVVAGDGEQRQAVDALGRELLGDRFKRVVLGRAEMPELYRCANVLLHMSQDEPFGNIYIEALASGLSVIAHESTVTRWIVEAHGRLVDTSDSGAVTGQLRDTLGAAAMDRKIARHDYAKRRFSWETITEQYCQFFHTVYGS
jgi:glycosyltransferase involved in cell wall biosynthesis